MKKLRLSQVDLSLFWEHALSEFNKFPTNGRLKGMTRAMNESEIRHLAFYKAAISMINSQGGLKEGFAESVDMDINIPDSEVAADDGTGYSPAKKK